ncbi:MAG TPA: hypothetical protein VK473_08455 [Terriglobales bacterium]|nr:hypothetical protein [Terriglobales bacterium]
MKFAREEIGLQLKVLYRDSDLIKARVFAWNGTFGGISDIYLAIDQLAGVAEQLQGFPQGISDSREVMLGTFDPTSAGGGMSMRFYCIDRSGRAYVDTKIESDQDSSGGVQSVALSLPIEGGAVDSFVGELRSLDAGERATAYLRGTASVC